MQTSKYEREPRTPKTNPVMTYPRTKRLAVLGPLVLATDLLLLLGREVVLDVECLADLVGGLALDHVGNGLAANVKQGLDVEVVGGLWMLA
jgi:hypothetical protein